MKAELARRLKTKAEAQKLLEHCRAAMFTIEDITTRPVKKKSGRTVHHFYPATGSCT